MLARKIELAARVGGRLDPAGNVVDVTAQIAALQARAHDVAAWLVARGAAPDAVVALQLRRSLEQIVAQIVALGGRACVTWCVCV